MVWLMMTEYSFTTAYLDSESMEYQVMSDDVKYEVSHVCNKHTGTNSCWFPLVALNKTLRVIPVRIPAVSLLWL